jgi:hypothetical protein
MRGDVMIFVEVSVGATMVVLLIERNEIINSNGKNKLDATARCEK